MLVMKPQEMEGRRLAELQRHGDELQELKYKKTELWSLYTQLEQKHAQREAEINRLQLHCQDLVKKVFILNTAIYSATSIYWPPI